jgi:hypothetical protein
MILSIYGGATVQKLAIGAQGERRRAKIRGRRTAILYVRRPGRRITGGLSCQRANRFGGK